MSLTDSEIAYWSACAAVAPVLGLAVVLEARYLSTPAKGTAYWARIMVTVMYALAGLASVIALGTSLEVLQEGETDHFSGELVPLLLSLGWSIAITNPLVIMFVNTLWDRPPRESKRVKKPKPTRRKRGRRRRL